jgi:hypothetical protein
MLDTQLFQMLVLFFKIFFYSAEMEEATIDMIDNPGYHMSYQFEQGEHTLEIMPIIDSVLFDGTEQEVSRITRPYPLSACGKSPIPVR